MTKYVGYYRVSTKKQGMSGLGLDNQKEKINDYINEDKERVLVNEYIEIQSGKNDKRKELNKAIIECKKTDSVLLIYKLDRFSRKVSFISKLMESSIKFIVVDMPDASDFQLHIFAAMSQEERRQISLRTKESLRQAKLRGVVLGKYSKVLSEKNRQEAKEYSFKFKKLLQGLMKKGFGYTRIAKYLNDNEYKTRQDKKFYSSTIKNMVGYY